MSTYGFLRISRRLAPGITAGTVTRSRTSGWMFLFALISMVLG